MRNNAPTRWPLHHNSDHASHTHVSAAWMRCLAAAACDRVMGGSSPSPLRARSSLARFTWRM